MSLFQFLRILFARRLFLLTALVSCVSVATISAFVLPKEYKASARVMLDIVKPDPVTGQVIANQFLHAYTNTQIELIRDQQVAGLVVDQMGWMSSPAVINAYQRATGGHGQDMRHWLATKVIDGTKADLIENSNILEISYTDRSAADAARIAGTIRNAFIDSTLQSRRDLAGKAADWFKGQVDKAKTVLADAEAARTQYARANNIVLQADNVDLESARLQALSSQSAAQASMERQVYPGDAAPAINTAKTQLEQLEQQIRQTGAALGPNHPSYQLLIRQRAVLEAEVDRERRTAHTKTQGDAQGAFAIQKARVVAQRNKIDQLNLMQRDIDVKRQQYVEASKRLGELRMEADVGEAGLTSLGEVIVPDKAFFPNKPLIIGGAFGFGAALGIVLSLLIELVQRRVRCAEDLEYSANVEVLATIGELRAATANVGCSFIAANLAIACAQIGINTALVDTDIRAPMVHRLFGLPETGYGLADHLAQRAPKIDPCLQNGLVTSLTIVTAGSIPPNPQELLAAQRFQSFTEQITSRFDLTIFDTTPTNSCTDAQRVATVVGHALIIARKHTSFVSDVTTLSRLLRADRANLVGSVMTVAD